MDRLGWASWVIHYYESHFFFSSLHVVSRSCAVTAPRWFSNLRPAINTSTAAAAAAAHEPVFFFSSLQPPIFPKAPSPATMPSLREGEQAYVSGRQGMYRCGGRGEC
ncbi:hypothetical protein PMIN03_004392 [Paraphaeosphaeria minitans]